MPNLVRIFVPLRSFEQVGQPSGAATPVIGNPGPQPPRNILRQRGSSGVHGPKVVEPGIRVNEQVRRR